MVEKISNIKLKIEELSTLLGFFKQKSIKQILYKNIEETKSKYYFTKNLPIWLGNLLGNKISLKILKFRLF